MFFWGEANLWSYRQRKRRDFVSPALNFTLATNFMNRKCEKSIGAAMSAALVLVHDNVW